MGIGVRLATLAAAGVIGAATLQPVTLRLAGNKPYCCNVARQLGIPVAAHFVFRLADIDRAWRFMAAHGGTFVVKPAHSTSSALGVSLHVCTRGELERAAALASLYGDEIMAEVMVPAESCRLLYLDGQLIHAVRRRGVRVAGDGRSSIRELLIRDGLQRLVSDKATLRTLQAQQLSLEDSIAAGMEIVVRHVPATAKCVEELRTVYDEAITALVCPQLARFLGGLALLLESQADNTVRTAIFLSDSVLAPLLFPQPGDERLLPDEGLLLPADDLPEPAHLLLVRGAGRRLFPGRRSLVPLLLGDGGLTAFRVEGIDLGRRGGARRQQQKKKRQEKQRPVHGKFPFHPSSRPALR